MDGKTASVEHGGNTTAATIEPDPKRVAIEPEPAPPHPLVVAIDDQLVAPYHGSIVSQTTEVYNHVLKAVTDLKARLTKGV